MNYYGGQPQLNNMPQPPQWLPANPPVPAAPVESRRPGPALANLCFFVAGVLFLVLSAVGEYYKWNYLGLEIIGEGSLAVVALLFCLLGRYNLRETFSLRRLDPLTIFLCVLVGLSGQFAVRFPSALNEWFMQIFGPFPTDNFIPSPPDTGGRLILFVIVVLVAPLCEETLNRGFVLAGYRRLSFGKAIFFVGLLFGIFHLYPFRFAYTFLLGMALAYLVLTTRSILSSMACHFGFNLLGGFAPWLQDWVKQTTPTDTTIGAGDSLINFQTVMSTVPVSLCAAGIFFVLLILVSKRMARQRPELELNYVGLVRRINSGPVLNQPSPYYNPDWRYVYGRYGFARAELTPASPYPAWGASPNWPVADGGTNYRPPAPPNRLPPGLQVLWVVSFVPILLMYGFTSFSEIAIRMHPKPVTPTHNTAYTAPLPVQTETYRLISTLD